MKSTLYNNLKYDDRYSRAMELTAYDVKAKKKVKIENPKVVKMKNGRWAVTGKSAVTGNKVYRILSKEEKAAMK
jgi:hypothetical protein